jgi:hypothetical protein
MGWKLRPWPEDATPPADAHDWTALAERIISPEHRADAVDVLRARFWFNRYVGTGNADPAAARTAPLLEQPYATGAWAIEWVRIAGVDADLAGARAVWDGRAPPPVGLPIAVERRVGRYDPGVPIPDEASQPHISTFGDGRRLVGAGDGSDRDIALLEALYFAGVPTGERFADWLDDPRRRVRLTAFRFYRNLPSEGVRERLERYRADPDPAVRAHVDDALRYETWRGRGNHGSAPGQPSGAPLGPGGPFPQPPGAGAPGTPPVSSPPAGAAIHSVPLGPQ